MKKLIAFCACALLVVVAQASATPETFCYDNTDQIIKQIKKVEPTNEQLKDLFVYQGEHRALIKKAHAEHLGCRMHEDNEVEFQKSAFGVLTDEQFKQLKGRVRNETESLRHENYELKKQLEALQKQLEELKAALVKNHVGKTTGK